MILEITRGGTSDLDIQLFGDDNITPLTPDSVSKITFTFGTDEDNPVVVKEFPHDVDYNTDTQSYHLRLEQTDTLRLFDGIMEQEKVLFKDGTVGLTDMEPLTIKPTNNAEVL